MMLLGHLEHSVVCSGQVGVFRGASDREFLVTADVSCASGKWDDDHLCRDDEQEHGQCQQNDHQTVLDDEAAAGVVVVVDFARSGRLHQLLCAVDDIIPDFRLLLVVIIVEHHVAGLLPLLLIRELRIFLRQLHLGQIF